MGKRYLMNSNVVIDFCNGRMPENGRVFLMAVNPKISIVTNFELFATKNISKEEYELLEKFVAFSIIHSVNKDLVNTTIHIRQTYKVKLPNDIIAASALVHNLTLISRNSKYFSGIEGLEFINPYGL
jgi:predicted nucleic acid-binding protein